MDLPAEADGGATRPRDVTASHPGALIGAAWVVILAGSLLPAILLQELLGMEITLRERALSVVIIAAVGAVVTVVVPWLRPLRALLAVLAVLVPGQWLVFTVAQEISAVRDRLASPSFAVSMPIEVSLNLVVTLAMLALLAAIHRDRHAFYLARGDIAAPAGPIRWLGVGSAERWSTLGPILTVAISGGTLAFLLLSGTASGGMVGAIVAALPAVLFAAALNAFNEEVSYKASILSVLERPLGRRDALRMVAAYFGIAHFYGVPYGIVGVVLAWFLGWILGRSMADTRGIAWAWLIHFVQDVLIFGFMAAAAIVPGGS